MNGDALRAMVREVLAEELKRLKAERSGAASAPRPQAHEERVSIGSDSDLAAFVTRLLELSRDGHTRREIEEGRFVFRLSGAAAPGRPGSPAEPAPASVRIDSGMITERQVDALPSGTRAVVAAKAVRFTPLARDRLRSRSIAIERSR